MLFRVTKTCNIRVKWRGWQKKHIRQMMIWQWWMQRILSMLRFGEIPFTVVCCVKYDCYLVSAGDKVGELSRWKYMILIEIEEVANKKLGHEIFWTLSSIHSSNGTSSQLISKDKEKVGEIERRVTSGLWAMGWGPLYKWISTKTRRICLCFSLVAQMIEKLFSRCRF